MRFFRKLLARFRGRRLRRVIIEALREFGCTHLKREDFIRKLISLRPAIRQKYRRIYELPTYEQLKGTFGEPYIPEKPD